MKRIFFIVSILCVSVNVMSQNVVTMTSVDKEKMALRIVQEVRRFQNTLSILAGNEYTRTEKTGRLGDQMDYFIGKGKSYWELTPYGDSILKDPVKMTVAQSKNDKSKRDTLTMLRYLSRLITNSENPQFRYRKVVIESSESIRVDNIKKIGNGRYVGTATFMQKYSGFKTNEKIAPDYFDYTTKTIIVYVNVSDEFYDPEVGDWIREYDILLGDVDVTDIW